MSCFSCFGSKKSRKSYNRKDCGSSTVGKMESTKRKSGQGNKKCHAMNQADKENITAQTFTFRELATATKNFRQECLLGEGGFGRVFKGRIASTGQVVAVKQLDRNGMQGNKQFLVEVLMLSLLRHPNLVNLVGYCADGDQRLLVYEFMSGGSLEDHILDIENEQNALDWETRMKIAFGAAKGLEYLHDKANPPVIYRDLKPSNILLDEDLAPKLSDFVLAKLGNAEESMHVSSRVVGTYGYSAPEYARGGQLTLKSDVYSFGVVFLELITGRRALDTTRPMEEQNLVAWAQPIFRDPKRFPDMADPLLNKEFPEKNLNQAVAIAAMCLQEEPAARPLMSDVVSALSFLSLNKAEFVPSPVPTSSLHEESAVNHAQKTKNEDNSDKEAKACDSHQNQDKHEEDNLYHPNENESSNYKNNGIILDESNSSSDDSSSDSSHQESHLRSKNSKKSSRKSSMNSLRYKSMSRKGSMNSQNDNSMSRKSSMNAHRDNSMSHISSMGSRDDTEHLSYKSVSQNGSNSFENGSNDGSFRFVHNDD